MSMSMTAKAAWPLLWTECDDHGIFEWKPIVLKARIFPADNVDFSAILDEYEKLGCIKRREIDGKPYGLVRNFCRYQRPKNPSYRYTLPEDETEYVGLKVSNTPGLPQGNPSPTEKAPQMKEEGGRREEEGGKESNSLRSLRDEMEREFDDFYQQFPRHEGRGHALKAYRGARKTVDSAKLLEGAVRARERYRDSDPKFVPLPATWLHGQRWLDEAIPAASAKSAEHKAKMAEYDEFYRGVL